MKPQTRFTPATLVLAIGMVASFLLPGTSFAQEINHPKSHIPNHLANKITNVRLRALVAEDEIGDEVNEQLHGIGFRGFEQVGCNVNIGNIANTSPGASLDKDVVVIGDVINYCP